jgi:ribose 5-phosphate isomerase B
MRDFIIGCDNAAVELKNLIKEHLEGKGYKVESVGPKTADDSTYYPLVAEELSKKIQESNFEKRGILICGTGIGMAMTANKCKGIRAAACHDNYSAERSVLSNNSNVLCMGSRVIGVELAKKIVDEWVTLEFVEGSSTPKVDAIKDIESRNFK